MISASGCFSSALLYNQDMNNTPKYKIFVDLDGVLADFDKGIEKLTGSGPDKDNLKRDDKAMWKAVDAAGTFYRDLEPMADADELWAFLAPLKPTILTGIPKTAGAAEQKREWCAGFVGNHVPVITCPSRNKINEAQRVTPEGVIPLLIDDWTKDMDVWKQGGGVFVLHTSAADTIAQLETMGGN